MAAADRVDDCIFRSTVHQHRVAGQHVAELLPDYVADIPKEGSLSPHLLSKLVPKHAAIARTAFENQLRGLILSRRMRAGIFVADRVMLRERLRHVGRNETVIG